MDQRPGNGQAAAKAMREQPAGGVAPCTEIQQLDEAGNQTAPLGPPDPTERRVEGQMLGRGEFVLDR